MVSGAGSRGCEGPAAPRPELAQLSLHGCSSPGFSLMAFFWSERLSWPLLPCTCRRIKRWNWEKGPSCSLLPPHVFEAAPGMGRGSSEPCLAVPLALEVEPVCGSHSWREMKLLKPFLWLWKGAVNPQLASGTEHGVKSVQSLPVRHKRIK